MFIAIVGLTLGIVLMLALQQGMGSYYHSSLQQFTKIRAQIAAQNYIEAQNMLHSLLKKNCTKKEALLYQIQILQGLGKIEEAYEISRKYRKKWGLKKFQIQEAISLYLLDRNEEAIAAFFDSQEQLENEKEKLYFALALHRINRWADALSILRPYQFTSKEPKLTSLIVDCLIKLEKYIEAVGYLTSLLQNQENFMHQTQLAEVYLCLEEIQTALPLYEQLYQMNPNHISVLLGYSNCLEKIGDHNQTIFILRNSPFWDYFEPNIALQAVRTLMHLEEYYQAEKIIKKLFSHKICDCYLLSQLGICLQRQEKFHEAEEIYLQILEQDPNHLMGLKFLVWLKSKDLTQKISMEKALEMAHKLTQISPEANHFELLSMCEALSGNYDYAIKILTQILETDATLTSRVRRQRLIRQFKSQFSKKIVTATMEVA